MIVAHISLMDFSSGGAVVTNTSGFRVVMEFFVRDSVKNLIDYKRKSIFTGLRCFWMQCENKYV
jgi:hypothetical protein